MKLLLILMALLVAPAAYAHSNPQEHREMERNKEQVPDTLDVDWILHENTPEDFPVSGVPRLKIVGKGNKFIFGAGGFVKAIAGWDIGHVISSPDEFITSQIPMGPMEGNGSRFNLSARQTHLYVNFVILPSTENQIGIFVGANFLNEDYMPVLQYAYLHYRGFKAGYDNSLFSDPACGAPSVDYEGPCSNTTNPVGGISYLWKGGHWEAGAGIELPQTSFTTEEGKTKFVYQRAPDIPFAARYSWGGGDSWVRLSAILRTLTFRDELQHKNKSRLGYGFQISGAEYFLDRFTFFWQGVWGKGIGSMIQDTVDEGLDMVPSSDGTSLSPVMLWGGFLALQYDICNRVSASVTYSQMRTYAKRFDGGDTPWGDLYKYAQYVSSNVFYKATSFFEIGLEHIWGRRTNYDRRKGADNRIQASFQLTF